jgi:hypothetical protein
MVSFMFARQRSGTGALGSVLDRHPQLKYVGEVLHPEDTANEDNFFGFLAANETFSAAFCDPRRRTEVVERYFEWLTERYQPRLPVIDVKYRSLHHWNGSWQGVTEAPWLIRHIKAQNLPVIHMKRKNYLETYISGQLAEENSVWHASSDTKITVRETVVDIKQMCRSLAQTAEEVRLVDLWQSGHRNMLVLEYAMAFDQKGHLKGEVARNLKTLLKLSEDFVDLVPSFVKQAPVSVSQSILNLPLVELAIRGTEFEWMLGK